MDAIGKILALVLLLLPPMAEAEVVPLSGSKPSRPGSVFWDERLNGLSPQVMKCWDVESMSPIARAQTFHVKIRFSQTGKPEVFELLGSDGGADPVANRVAYNVVRRAIYVCGADGYDLAPVDWRATVFAVLRFDAAEPRIDVSYWGYE